MSDDEGLRRKNITTGVGNFFKRGVTAVANSATVKELGRKALGTAVDLVSYGLGTKGMLGPLKQPLAGDMEDFLDHLPVVKGNVQAMVRRITSDINALRRSDKDPWVISVKLANASTTHTDRHGVVTTTPGKTATIDFLDFVYAKDQLDARRFARDYIDLLISRDYFNPNVRIRGPHEVYDKAFVLAAKKKGIEGQGVRFVGFIRVEKSKTGMFAVAYVDQRGKEKVIKVPANNEAEVYHLFSRKYPSWKIVEGGVVMLESKEGEEDMSGNFSILESLVGVQHDTSVMDEALSPLDKPRDWSFFDKTMFGATKRDLDSISNKGILVWENPFASNATIPQDYDIVRLGKFIGAFPDVDSLKASAYISGKYPKLKGKSNKEYYDFFKIFTVDAFRKYWNSLEGMKPKDWNFEDGTLFGVVRDDLVFVDDYLIWERLNPGDPLEYIASKRGRFLGSFKSDKEFKLSSIFSGYDKSIKNMSLSDLKNKYIIQEAGDFKQRYSDILSSYPLKQGRSMNESVGDLVKSIASKFKVGSKTDTKTGGTKTSNDTQGLDSRDWSFGDGTLFGVTQRDLANPKGILVWDTADVGYAKSHLRYGVFNFAKFIGAYDNETEAPAKNYAKRNASKVRIMTVDEFKREYNYILRLIDLNESMSEAIQNIEPIDWSFGDGTLFGVSPKSRSAMKDYSLLVWENPNPSRFDHVLAQRGKFIGNFDNIASFKASAYISDKYPNMKDKSNSTLQYMFVMNTKEDFLSEFKDVFTFNLKGEVSGKGTVSQGGWDLSGSTVFGVTKKDLAPNKKYLVWEYPSVSTYINYKIFDRGRFLGSFEDDKGIAEMLYATAGTANDLSKWAILDNGGNPVSYSRAVTLDTIRVEKVKDFVKENYALLNSVSLSEAMDTGIDWEAFLGDDTTTTVDFATRLEPLAKQYYARVHKAMLRMPLTNERVKSEVSSFMFLALRMLKVIKRISKLETSDPSYSSYMEYFKKLTYRFTILVGDFNTLEKAVANLPLSESLDESMDPALDGKISALSNNYSKEMYILLKNFPDHVIDRATKASLADMISTSGRVLKIVGALSGKDFDNTDNNYFLKLFSHAGDKLRSFEYELAEIEPELELSESLADDIISKNRPLNIQYVKEMKALIRDIGIPSRHKENLLGLVDLPVRILTLLNALKTLSQNSGGSNVNADGYAKMFEKACVFLDHFVGNIAEIEPEMSIFTESNTKSMSEEYSDTSDEILDIPTDIGDDVGTPANMVTTLMSTSSFPGAGFDEDDITDIALEVFAELYSSVIIICKFIYLGLGGLVPVKECLTGVDAVTELKGIYDALVAFIAKDLQSGDMIDLLFSRYSVSLPELRDYLVKLVNISDIIKPGVCLKDIYDPLVAFLAYTNTLARQMQVDDFYDFEGISVDYNQAIQAPFLDRNSDVRYLYTLGDYISK